MLALSGTAMFGIDRFYLGYIIWGIVKAVTLGGFGIWALIDAIFITHCWLKDANGRVMEGCSASQLKTMADVGKGLVKDAGGSVGADTDVDGGMDFDF
mgnify:CR=1 FL=1